MVDRPDRSEVDDIVEALRDAGVAPGLEVGEEAPDFTLGDAFGGRVRLAERLERGPVVLSFYRGAWCPICSTELRAQQEALPAIRALGAGLIAVSPQPPDTSAELVGRLGLGFDVVSDLDQAVIGAYRVGFELPAPLRARHERARVPLGNADGSWRLPVPATFVIDTARVVRARHVDVDFRRRLPVDELLAALRALP